MTKRTKAAPEDAASQPNSAAPGGKLGAVVELLRRPNGASISDMMTATGWQSHSIRGVLAGTLKKKHGFAITSEKADGERRYRIAETTA